MKAMMSVPVSILLEVLDCEGHIAKLEERSVCKISFPSPAKDGDAGLAADCLYICGLSDALALHKQFPDAIFFCPRQSHGKLPENVVVVRDELSDAGIFCAVQDKLVEIQQWHCEMLGVVYQNLGFQHLLELSIPIIGNTINISDSTFRRIASTDRLDTDDQITLSFRENNGHPAETIRNFFDTGRYDYWEKNNCYIDESYVVSRYILVGRIFRFHNTYFTHVVMTCDHHAPTPGVLACYQMLSECIGLIAAKDWEKSDAFIHPYDAVLSDVISGRLDDPEIIELRTKYVGLAADGRFVLVNIPLALSGNYSVGRFGQDMTRHFPMGKVMLYHGSILLLNLLDRGTEAEQLKKMKCTLNALLAPHGLSCGISSYFSHLKRLRCAYQQTCRTLEILQKQNEVCPLKDDCVEDCCFHIDETVYDFNDSYEYCSLDLSDEALARCKGSIYFQALAALYHYDNTHRTNNLQLLRVYLQCERSLSMTSQLMHMHRNNVAYRVRRIEEITGIDLNDYNSRLRLQIAYLQYNKVKGPGFPDFLERLY